MQAYYPKLELQPLADKRPFHKNGKEVRLECFFERVMPVVRISEKDCKLEGIIGNL